MKTKPGAGLSCATYNPDLIERDSFVAQFVARIPLLTRLVEDLREAKPQHHLLHGQRGMGKSSLLRRLQLEIDDDPALRERWLPLSFPEEQWNVAHLSDFWMNGIEAAVEALTLRGDEALIGELDELDDGGDEAKRSKAALKKLQNLMKRGGFGLALLVDNFDGLLERISPKERWALRKVLGHERMVLVGACVSVPRTVVDHGEAFYDGFKLDALRGLSDVEMIEVLRRLSEARASPHVREVIAQDPGRIRALRALTGGNPRTVVLLHDLLARDDTSAVDQDLAALLDQVTPLYKARLEEIAPQAQQVFSDVALRWAPTTASEAAKRLRMDVKTVSAQLDRLIKQGLLEKVPHATGRTRFQVGERFFNIWYLMRASRRMRRKLLWLVEFLRVFYGDEALRSRARVYLGVPAAGGFDGRAHQISMLRAYADVVDDQGLCSALDARAAEVLIDARELRRKLEEIVDLAGDDDALAPTVDRIGAMREMERSIREVKVKQTSGWDPEVFWRLLGGSASLDLSHKQKIVRALPRMTVSALKRLSAQLAEEESGWASGQRTRHLSEAIRCGISAGPDDVEGAARAVLRFGQGLVDEALTRRLSAGVDAAALEQIGEYLPHAQEAETWRAWMARAIELDVRPERLDVWVERAKRESAFWDPIGLSISKEFRGKASHARSVAGVLRALMKEMVRAEPNNLHRQRTLADYCARFGDLDGSFAAMQAVVAQDQATVDDWMMMGRASLNIHHCVEASAAFERVLALNPTEPESLAGLAYARLAQGHTEGLRPRLEEALKEAKDQDIALILGVIELLEGSTSGLARVRDGATKASKLQLALLGCNMLVDCHDAYFARRIFSHIREKWGVNFPFIDAAITALEGKDHAALAMMRDAVTQANSDSDLRDLNQFSIPFMVFVRLGFARELLLIVEEVTDGEEWRPLTEALRLLTKPHEHALEDLPAEIRDVTGVLVGLLSSRALVVAEPSPTKRRARRAGD